MMTKSDLNPKPRLSEYQDAYAGYPAVILGGGPSLQSDLESVPAHALRIAVNHHPYHVDFINPLTLAFIVYNDPPFETGVGDVLLKYSTTRVSPDQATSDVLFDVPVWTSHYSGCTATWLALWLGCDPVILCGFDMYLGERKYCHDDEPYKELTYYPLEHHLRPWVEEARNLLPHVERVRAVSGPLMGVFGRWEAMGVK